MKKYFIIICQFYSNTFNDTCALKAQVITFHFLRFFSKYFLNRQHNRYIGFAIYIISLILIKYICLNVFLIENTIHPMAGHKTLIQIINKSGNIYSYER